MSARAGRLFARLWRWISGSWPALSAAVIGWTFWLAPQPLTWRRPVRDEFWRFVQLAGPGSLAPMLIAAVLVGAGLVGQGIFWLDAVGQREVVLRVLLSTLVREVTPIVVGLVTLGRAGLMNLSELGALRADGTLRTLEAQGLDPVVLLAVPRTLALALCTFVHSVIFLAIAVLVGYLVANVLGVSVTDPATAARRILQVLGESGLFVLPFKTVLIGAAIAATTTVTALTARPHGRDPDLTPQGFFRALLGLFLVTAIVTVIS